MFHQNSLAAISDIDQRSKAYSIYSIYVQINQEILIAGNLGK